MPGDASNNGMLIQIKDMSKTYVQDTGEQIPVLHGVNMHVNLQEIVALMGPSGSGKSTLLHILGLFLNPTGGQYIFDNIDVLSLSRPQQSAFRRRQVGFVFQTTDLLEKSTVYENLEFPLIYAKVQRKQRKDRILKALERVNLGHRINHPTNRLSGGERQRVSVARALVNEPRVILADEPTGQLDRENTRMVMDHFRHIATSSDTSVVVVTHDPHVASWCDRTYVMEDGALWEQDCAVS